MNAKLLLHATILALMVFRPTVGADDASRRDVPAHSGLDYRIGIVGWPSKPDLPWTEETLRQIQGLGFNAVQLNIAWLWRPADEILNFEDVVSGLAYPGQQSGANTAKRGPQSLERRRHDLRHRIELCRQGWVAIDLSHRTSVSRRSMRTGTDAAVHQRPRGDAALPQHPG